MPSDASEWSEREYTQLGNLHFSKTLVVGIQYLPHNPKTGKRSFLVGLLPIDCKMSKVQDGQNANRWYVFGSGDSERGALIDLEKSIKEHVAKFRAKEHEGAHKDYIKSLEELAGVVKNV